MLGSYTETAAASFKGGFTSQMGFHLGSHLEGKRCIVNYINL